MSLSNPCFSTADSISSHLFRRRLRFASHDSAVTPIVTSLRRLSWHDCLPARRPYRLTGKPERAAPDRAGHALGSLLLAAACGQGRGGPGRRSLSPPVPVRATAGAPPRRRRPRRESSFFSLPSSSSSSSRSARHARVHTTRRLSRPRALGPAAVGCAGGRTGWGPRASTASRDREMKAIFICSAAGCPDLFFIFT